MTNYFNAPINLSATQLTVIRAYGNAVLNGTAQNYSAMYQYISDEIKAGRIVGVEPAQAFWFEGAAKINANDTSSPTSVYIRTASVGRMSVALSAE